MQLRKWILGTLAVAGLCQGGIVQAAKDKPIVTAQAKEDFAAVAADVRKQMVPGGRFEFIKSQERDTVDQRLNDMASLFDTYGSVDRMNQDAKIRLFNDQEEVNAILRRRDDKRRICESVAPVGSHIPRISCITYREQEVSRRQTEQFMDSTSRHSPLKLGN